MSENNAEVNQTVAEMWEAFLRMATRNNPARDVSVEVRVAYYAGCHNMMEKMMATLREEEVTPGALKDTWQKLSDELFQFSQDYNAGRIN